MALPTKNDLLNVAGTTAAKFSAAMSLLYDFIAGLTGANVSNTPAGNIASTNVQAAINELDSEKVAYQVGTNVVRYFDLAEYSINGATVTGTVKLTLPTSWTATMMQLELDMYDYTTNGTSKLLLGGYNYLTSTAWYSYSAKLIGNAPITSVRFAHDGTNCCILLGVTTTVWRYPKIRLSKFIAGLSNQTLFASGWTITQITSETGITVTGSIDLVQDSTVNAHVADVSGTNHGAVSTNTANMIVRRDASGNFSAGTITAALTGNATTSTTATTSSYIVCSDGDRLSSTKTPSGNPNRVRFDFVGAAQIGSGGTYAGLMTFSPYDGTTASTGDCSYQLGFGSSARNTGDPQLKIRNGIDTTWNAWKDIITSVNIGSQSVATATTATNLSGFNNSNSANPLASPDNATTNGISYTAGVSLFGQADGALFHQAYSSSWMGEIYQDYRTGQLASRGKNSGTWGAWRTQLDSSNYTSYAPTLTGAGASGSWGISVTGNANTATTATTANVINGTYTGSGGFQPPSYIPSGQVRWNMMNGIPNTSSNYKDVMLMDTYTGGDVPYVTALALDKTNGSPNGYLLNGVKGAAAWSSVAQIMTNSNIASQANMMRSLGDGTALTTLASAPSNSRYYLSINGKSDKPPADYDYGLLSTLSGSTGGVGCEIQTYHTQSKYGTIWYRARWDGNTYSAWNQIVTNCPSAVANTVCCNINNHEFYSASNTNPAGVNTPRTMLSLYAGGCADWAYDHKWKFKCGCTGAIANASDKTRATLVIGTETQADAFATCADVLTLDGAGNLSVTGTISSNGAKIPIVKIFGPLSFYLNAANYFDHGLTLTTSDLLRCTMDVMFVAETDVLQYAAGSVFYGSAMYGTSTYSSPITLGMYLTQAKFAIGANATVYLRHCGTGVLTAVPISGNMSIYIKIIYYPA